MYHSKLRSEWQRKTSGTVVVAAAAIPLRRQTIQTQPNRNLPTNGGLLKVNWWHLRCMIKYLLQRGGEACAHVRELAKELGGLFSPSITWVLKNGQVVRLEGKHLTF